MKKGDAVQFEYRDKYDRETGTGIIVEIKNDRYKVVLVQREKEIWYWTNYWEWESAEALKPLGKTVKELGLEL